MKDNVKTIAVNDVESKVITLRNQFVLIDKDVADLYGVETKRINEAVRNNPEKFPDGYVFELQLTENQQLVENFDRFKTLKHSSSTKAFTEKGLYMLATILKSPIATQTSIAIIESYARVKELNRNIQAIHNEPDNKKQKGIIQKTGELLSDLICDEADAVESESSVELNLMAIKFKHTVKKTKKR